MITIAQLRDWLNETLINDEYNFKIFSDVADYQKAFRPYASNDIIHYVNGLMTPEQPQILSIKNLQVVTQNVEIAFAIDMDKLEKDANGNYIEVDNIKNILSLYIEEFNGKPFSLTDNAITYEITPYFNGLTDDTVDMLSPIGDTFTIYLSMGFTIIQSGINSNSFDFILNGENLFTQDISLSRTRMAETNLLNGQNSTKTAMQTNSLSLHINMPLLSTTQNLKLLEDALNGGQNNANVLCIKNAYSTKFYLVGIGNNSLSFEPSKNIGISFDLVELSAHISNFDNTWTSGSVATGNWSISQSLASGETLFIAFDNNDIVYKTNTAETTQIITITGNNTTGQTLYYHKKVV